MPHDLKTLTDFSAIEKLIQDSSKVTTTPEKAQKQIVTLAAVPCPHCQKEITGQTDSTVSPVGGDMSICANCAELVVFNDDLTLRKPEYEDWLRVTSNPKIERDFERTRAMLKRLRKH